MCDDLKYELEEYFKGRYNLVEVDIAHKENLRWLRLYRYEIPVLFLEGQYLCKHRLDKDQLEKRLRELENLE
ncbi:glutaredoxin-like protein C5orf63 homolog [Ctenocephalides felis]|nr:glutaredoxin-like protein C5orf63 homolog [Ctenocephalides felis]